MLAFYRVVATSQVRLNQLHLCIVDRTKHNMQSID